MTRKITLSFLILAVAFTAGLVFIGSQGESIYKPRVQESTTIGGYFEYLASFKNNQITGDVTQEDVEVVIDQIKEQRRVATKKAFPITWSFTGPDDIGGRTRAILVDRTDSKILYAGGVSGSLFRSTNKGASWKPITISDDYFGVVSLAQTKDNAVFYGTGEGAFTTAAGTKNGTPGFAGNGIFKSTDGVTFTQLQNTTTFGAISVLAVHPTQDWIFAGTQAGLYYSDDGGSSWSQVRPGSCRDVKFSKNGVVLAYIGSSIFRSTSPTDGNSYSIVTGFTPNTRMAIAWAESDPNFCYVVSAGNVTINSTPYPSAFNGLYKSTDAGVNFTKVVNKAGAFFAPFTVVGVQSQGDYNMAIGVHPRNKDRVFIGGVQFAEWTPEKGPEIVGSTFDDPRNNNGIHSDKHIITFDNSGTSPIMYIGHDGGISKTTNADLDEYAGLNIGYITTQFYGIAAAPQGWVVGGTQDNNTILISKESFPRKNGIEIISGDGFQTEISQKNSDIAFGESQYGNLRRTVNKGGSISPIWDNRVSNSLGSGGRPTSYFDTPMHLWENPAAIEDIRTFGDSAPYSDGYKARLFFCLNNGIWMANNATSTPHTPDKPSDENIRWFRVSSLTNVRKMVMSEDGNSLFVSKTGQVFRIDGFNIANWDTTELANTQISDSLTITDIGGNLIIGGRAVTGIALDKSDPNRVAISLANYNNSAYVYITENAMDPSPTWTNIQNNLPRMPLYDVLISADDPNIILVGSEFGVWGTDQGTSSNPTWVESLTGTDPNYPMPRVPVWEFAQVAEKNWTGHSIYAGTHGMGIWESGSQLTSIKPEDNKVAKESILKAFPNPAHNVVSLETDIKGSYTLNIYSLNGGLIQSLKGSSKGAVVLETAELKSGNYFVEIIGQSSKAVSKIIVQH